MDQIRYKVSLLAADYIGRGHDGFTGAFRPQARHHPADHALPGGENKQRKAEFQGGGPHRLQRKGSGVLVGRQDFNRLRIGPLGYVGPAAVDPGHDITEIVVGASWPPQNHMEIKPPPFYPALETIFRAGFYFSLLRPSS